MRRIAVVTTSRADYGIYRPLLRRLGADAGIELQLIVAGMHLLGAFGSTVRDIEADGFPIAARIDMLDPGDDSPRAVAEAMGQGTRAYGAEFDRLAPDIVVVLGDRFEMHAAAVAAQPFPIAVAHIHGGELTLGAMDDSLRHAMTKMAHLHFPATETYARRIRQLGEEDWRITVSGAPALDNLLDMDLAGLEELRAMTGLALDDAPLLVTYHPPTRDPGDLEARARALLGALEKAGRPVIVTAPNADEGGRRLMALFEDWCAARADGVLVHHLGTRAYFGLMSRAAAMVGNSSSGIVEAASFALPVVNVGTRQEGRARAANVIDVTEDADAICAGLATACSDSFRGSLAGMKNPYAAGRPAAEIIHQRLAWAPLGKGLLKKGFVDRI